MKEKKINILDLQAKKEQNKRITMLTAYDYPIALLVDQAGIDIILVGDSLAMVVLGYENTLPVTMDEMIHHCKAVNRGAKNAFLVGDMPFMSYQVDMTQAIANAGRFLKEGMMDAVKLEGGQEMTKTIKAIVDAGIPVMGHIGLTPQSVSKLGGYRVRGKNLESAQKLINDATALQKAGCFSIVLEAIPDRLAKLITDQLSIPTIGIGAGSYCDGQVLVIHDLIGLFGRFTPKFVKKYTNISNQILKALQKFKDEVEKGAFPTTKHSYTMSDEVFKEVILKLEQEKKR
jgi:3-methyl-2-oxobutanoate hydroxymethyltransferase